MRKLNFIFLFFALTTLVNAQSDLFLKVKKAMKENYPEINLSNRLIAVNVWSAKNADSREANKEFSRVYKIYEFAKLKGGLKGLICVSINNEGELSSTLINKDGAAKLIQLNSIDVSGLDNMSNIVFDDEGKEVYTNIKSDKIFESINKLITR